MDAYQLKHTFENELIPEVVGKLWSFRNREILEEILTFAFVTGTHNYTTDVLEQLLDVNTCKI